MNFQKLKVTTTTTPAASPAATERIGQTERALGADFVPREIIKFELSDAKVPDFQQHRYHPKQPNSRPRQRKARRRAISTSTETVQIDENSNDKEKTSGDQSSSDSRVLTISHPGPTPRGVKQLPFSVQKAINHALKQDFNIPFLDTIKYYFKDPTPKTTKLAGVDRLPAGAKLFSDSRIKQWWQLPPNLKSTSSLTKMSATTIKPIGSSSFMNDYVAYPLLRTYPVQYSMNVASDLVNGVGFLYGDRIFSKPYTYQKNINQVNSVTSHIKPVVEPKPFQDDEIINGVYRTTQSSILSTSPVVFPTSSEAPKTQTFYKYYTAELPAPTDPDTGVPLSNDKNTISLIHKAVSELKKHNPHLNVVPKRLEKDELVVHVTPKPDYYVKSTTVLPSSTMQAFKDIVTDKNLVYLNKVANSVKKPHIAGHAFLTHVEVPSNFDDLV